MPDVVCKKMDSPNRIKKIPSSTYVLEDKSPDDVSRSMIEGGRQKQPFYIFNMDEAWRRIQHFMKIMPRVKIFYAMKSNDSELLLKLAVALGVSTLVNKALDELFPDENVQITAEPGKYISDSAFKLFCSICGVRRRFSETTVGLLEDTILWGPSGDSLDRLMKDTTIQLPRCALTDWLVMENHGSYTITVSTKFSSLERPLIRSVASVELWNLIKNSSIFEESDFILNPDLKDKSPDDVSRSMIEGGRQKQPFYIFNMDEAWRRIEHFMNMMPRVKMFYGFNCASPGEIFKVRQLGVNPMSIIYTMPTKTPEQMKYARDTGVRHTTFDSSLELKKLLIRIRVDSDCELQLGKKFGCDYETEAFDLLDEAANLGVRHARLLFDHEAEAGRRMDIVDIGGGFQSDSTDKINEVSTLINKALDELFPDENVQIIAEPGKYISNSAFKLFNSICGVRRVYLNDGLYGTMGELEKWHKLSKFQRSYETTVGLPEDTILFGPTCDSVDQSMKDITIRLPRCAPTDWLVMENHGSYTITAATMFSSLERPQIRSVASVELWNLIKNSSIFEESDFILNPDLSAPLPSTMPPSLPTMEVYEHSQVPTFKC
ncbi:Uncharacterized protein OBRU01_07889 [Operophtera brumata]|uniref:Ornithine decarboxylase n=1 Tax=Operophtera brumata TaxID=104452 RepID=A0A0L7L7M9_OPEBR|nr:Uncharacterized protein OBRU01_07889 [Operophtera brumata]